MMVTLPNAAHVLANLATYYPNATDYEIAGFYWLQNIYTLTRTYMSHCRWQGDKDSTTTFFPSATSTILSILSFHVLYFFKIIYIMYKQYIYIYIYMYAHITKNETIRKIYIYNYIRIRVYFFIFCLFRNRSNLGQGGKYTISGTGSQEMSQA